MDGRRRALIIAMNKWALDRFNSVGPLLPQNFQLIDLSGDTNGGKMQLLYDLPIGLGEPHNAQMIKADKVRIVAVMQDQRVSLLPEVKTGWTNAVLGNWRFGGDSVRNGRRW